MVYYKSNPNPLQFKQSDIDTEKGIIKNVVMLEAGPAKGHGYHLEAEFVKNIIQYDQKHYSNGAKLKARFGHPSLSNETMGTQMGYFKNFRYDEERKAGIADLELLKSADDSPTNPNMRKWMLSMAQEATDFVMSSIVFSSDKFYQYNPDDGAKIAISRGDEIPYKNERIYIEFDESLGSTHLYTDIVEAGAATNSLFSQQFNKDKFAVKAVAFLQEHTDIHQFLKEHPEKLIEFAEKAGIDLPTKKLSFTDHLKGIFGAKQISFDEAMRSAMDEEKQLSELYRAKIEELKTAHEEELKHLKSAQELVVNELKDRISELEKEPIEPPLELEIKPPSVGERTDIDLINNSPLTRAARGEIDLNDYE